ncbi:hypothetical protein NDU88_003272 [Pleurodeles waltl]|uniref:Uncharacterized protein n=1 Tax=Pleurodeles waltl TaxID=8319 RepID=A0AAV7QF07_PLEWA|nr:hypothetical protein NDU88_003272 [Pleurodeles waltl]
MGRYPPPPPGPAGLRSVPGGEPCAGGAPCISAEARGLPGGGSGAGNPPTAPRAADMGELPLLSGARFCQGSAAWEVRAQQGLPHGTQALLRSSGGLTVSRAFPLSQERGLSRALAQLRLCLDKGGA